MEKGRGCWGAGQGEREGGVEEGGGGGRGGERARERERKRRDCDRILKDAPCASGASRLRILLPPCPMHLARCAAYFAAPVVKARCIGFEGRLIKSFSQLLNQEFF